MVGENIINRDEEVVISGVGGAFPKARNLEEFKHVLLSNETLLGSRWKEGEHNVSNKLGVISGMDLFDSAFFGIHRHQASFMDPMQRIILEKTFEAIVDAGVNPQDIRGRRIAVFTASSIGENDNLFYESVVSGFGVTGHSRAMMANRISYWLNLKGPSCAYDSNWNGGVEVLSMAVDAIRSGMCEAAIIGSANITLNPEISWHYNDMGVLSPDGSTKAFDADACGYARGDGCIVMFIQRASDAKRSYASVIHASTVFNGARDGMITDLCLDGMTDFIERFYDQCGVDPATVEYVEAYGSGIKETDEIELKAIEKVYCKNRKGPLLIGSVKTQTGHSEASANLMSIAKVLVAFESGIIPAHVQFAQPNPNIPGLSNGNLEVVTKNREWNGQLAACHGVGFVSSYSHVLLRRNPKIKDIAEDDLPQLVVASTRHEAGIQELLKTIQNQPNVDLEYIGLIRELFSKTISSHLYRGYIILDKSGNRKQEFQRYPGNKRPVWFIYSGMGSQWPRMACDLMKLPIFAASIMRSHQVLAPKGVDLLHIITTGDPSVFDNILHSFVGIAAIQIALTDILKAVGIVPDGIIGHSVGELGCAYADDCLTAEQMILCAYSRGKASIEADLIRGMMAAIGMGYNQIKDEVPPSIEVACHNAADSCTLSGPTDDMDVYVKSLQDRRIFARLVNVSNIAYHSQYIKPAGAGLLSYLKDVIPNPKRRSSKWVSTSVLEDRWDTELAKYCSAEYHTNNLLSSVYFEEGSRHIPKDAIAIEIAPHGLLQAILKRSLKGECTNIPLTSRNSKDPLEFLLSAIGKIYLTGVDVNVAAIYPPVSYPVSRSTMSLVPLVHWEHSERWRTGMEDKLNYLVSMKETQVTLNSNEFRQYAGHELDDSIVLPASAYLAILLEILTIRVAGEQGDVIFENVQFKNILVIPKVGSAPLYAMLQKGSGNFEILSGDTTLCTGKLSVPEPTDEMMAAVYEISVTEAAVHLTAKDVYAEFLHRGHKYSRSFKPIKELHLTEGGSVSLIAWEGKWQNLLEGMLQQVILQHGEKYQNVLVPSFVQKIVLSLQNLPSEAKDLRVTFNYATGIVSTDGVQVIGTQTKALKRHLKPLNYQSLEFVPLNNTACENLECGINNAIKLTLENFEDPTANSSIAIIEVETENPSLAEHIKNAIDKNVEINANLSVARDNKVAILSQDVPVLIVSNQEINEELAKTVQTTHAFALLRSSKDLRSHDKVVEILRFECDGVSYSLLRKVADAAFDMIRASGDVLSIKDLEKDTLSWVAELKAHLANPSAKRVLLVSYVAPTEGVVNFVQALKALPLYQPVRYLFLLDKRTRELDPKSDVFQKLARKDLACCVVKDGVFGTYVSVPVGFGKNFRSEHASPSTLIANKNLEFIGVNSDDETLIAKKYDVGLGNIDYSGVNNSGRRIMGLAKFNTDTCDLVPDSVLVWDLPESWSMEDGCSVPHAYTTAYHCLVQKGRLKHGDTVLIHNGCSAIGLAAISVAQSYGCTVYTTVATNQQRSYIKKIYVTLRDRNILSSLTTSFEPYFLMATGGVGAHVILNCLPDSLLSASIRCVAEFGRFVQLGKYDIKENNSIGMNMFLKNTSFIGVLPEEIFDAPEEEKQKLRALVQEGVNNFTVRPIRRVVVEHDDVRSILDTLTKGDSIGKILIKVGPTLSINYLNVDKPNQFICDARSAYLIYGGTSEVWAGMVEWLVMRGARKIVVSSDYKPQQVYINRRLNLLRSYFDADIIYLPNKAQNRDSMAELLSEVYSLGAINAVFVLPGKTSPPKSSEIRSVQYIDAALRTTAPKVLFVNLLSSAAGIAQHRLDAGYPTRNIQWPASLQFSEALYGLDEVLSLKTKNVVMTSEKDDDGQETSQALYKKLMLVLPQSSKDLLTYYKLSSKKPTFEQVMTSGPYKIREVPPVFIIPGLNSYSNITDMCKSLLYPTFVAQLPMTKTPLPEIAGVLAEEMKAIYPRGPYNVVGVSWGGVLAIEIGKVLQKQANVQVTFADGAPDTIQAVVNHLGADVSVEVNILSRILNITSTEVLSKLNGLPDWSSRLEVALGSCEETEDDLSLLRVALDVLLHRVYAAAGYSPCKESLKGEVFLIRPSGSNKYDDCGLNKYSTQAAQIHVVNGDHVSMLHYKEFVETLNDNVAVR